jgi:hypothetical protein
MKINVSDRKTQLIVGGVVLGLGVLIYFLFKNKPLGVEVMQFDENSIDSQGQIPENNLDVDLVLKQGSKGEEVKELQRVLINQFGQNLGNFGDNKDGVDGEFGTATLAGLLKAKQVSEIALKDL